MWSWIMSDKARVFGVSCCHLRRIDVWCYSSNNRDKKFSLKHLFLMWMEYDLSKTGWTRQKTVFLLTGFVSVSTLTRNKTYNPRCKAQTNAQTWGCLSSSITTLVKLKHVPRHQFVSFTTQPHSGCQGHMLLNSQSTSICLYVQYIHEHVFIISWHYFLRCTCGTCYTFLCYVIVVMP